MVLCPWWPWLTYKGVAQVCQHQLRYLLLYPRPSTLAKKKYLRFCRRSCRGPYMFNICCFYATWVVLMLVCISWFTARTIGFQNGDRPRYWIVKFSRNFCQKFKLSLISTSTCKFWAPKNEKVGRGHPLPIPHPPRRLDTRSFGALTPPFVSKKALECHILHMAHAL